MLNTLLRGRDPGDRGARRRDRPADRRRGLRHLRGRRPRRARRARRAGAAGGSERAGSGASGWPRFRAGVHTGEASVGVLGTGSGRTYSAIGDTVNLGSRIEGLAPAGGVAISAETARGSGGPRPSRSAPSGEGPRGAGRGAAARCACRRTLAAGLADPDAEHLGRPHRCAALLALDRERRRERRRALGAAVPRLAAAVRARGGQLGLVLEEVAPHRAAARDRRRCSRRASCAAPPGSSSASASRSGHAMAPSGSAGRRARSPSATASRRSIVRSASPQTSRSYVSRTPRRRFKSPMCARPSSIVKWKAIGTKSPYGTASMTRRRIATEHRALLRDRELLLVRVQDRARSSGGATCRRPSRARRSSRPLASSRRSGRRTPSSSAP